ncbi:MAG TPA: hypothetical protein VIM77_11420, partial [Mucilaginibacter sp.]
GILDDNDIEYQIAASAPAFDPGFRISQQKEYTIKISPNDFEKVNRLLNDAEATNVGLVDKDYYLYSFTETELIEVLTKAQEWSPFDCQLARKILTDKGININEPLLTRLENDRLEVQKNSDDVNKREEKRLLYIGGILLLIFVIYKIATLL